MATRAAALVRRIGLLDAVLFGLARALARATGGRAELFKYHFMAQPVPPVGVRAARPSRIEVCEIGGGDPRLALIDRPPDEIARRFAAGGRCIAAWHDGALAGFLWFAPGGYDEDEVRCTFRLDPADRAVWDFDVHIVPRYRLGRTFARLWEHAFTVMGDEGVLWSISRVTAFNADSLSAHQRLGAQRTGWAVFLLVGSLQFTLTNLGQIKCRRLEQGAYPAIEIRAPTNPRERESAAPAEGRPRVERVVSGDREERLREHAG